jgi:hypothetical protein
VKVEWGSAPKDGWAAASCAAVAALDDRARKHGRSIGKPERLPTSTEDDGATKAAPAGCVIRSVAGLMKLGRWGERDVAAGL